MSQRGERNKLRAFFFLLLATRISLFTAFCCGCLVIDGAWWSSDVISSLSTFNLGVQLGCLRGFGDREMAICAFSTPSWQVRVVWIAKNHKKLLKPLSQSSFGRDKNPLSVLSWLVFALSLGKSSVHVPLLWCSGCSVSLLLSFGIVDRCVKSPTYINLSLQLSCEHSPGATLSSTVVCFIRKPAFWQRKFLISILNAKHFIIQKLPIKCNGNLKGANCLPVSSIRCSVCCHCGRNDLSRCHKPRSSRMMQLNPSSSSSSFVWNTGAELKRIVLSGELRKTCSVWKQILEFAGEGGATGQHSGFITCTHFSYSHLSYDVLICGGYLIQAGLSPTNIRYNYSRNKGKFGLKRVIWLDC